MKSKIKLSVIGVMALSLHLTAYGKEASPADNVAAPDKESPALSATPYMGGPVELVEAPNGAIANKRILDGIGEVGWVEPTIEQPVEGIWVFGGYGLAPISIIDTDEGLIAFDTGDTKHDGELLLEAIRTVSDKPISAIIYGHSHTAFGAGVLAEGQEDLIIIGHPNLNDVVEANTEAAGFPAYFPEIGPYLTARGLIQFNAFMPSEGPDAWVVNTTFPEDFTLAFLPVNTPVEDGQEMTVLGQKMQFFTKYGSDDKVHTTVWLPDHKILFTTLLWSSPPQLYSVRGDVFRDPREWIAGLKFNRNLENYGEVSSYPPAIYYQSVGWYDNDAANLSTVAPLDEAKRIVPLMGGRNSVLTAAEQAMENKEYFWAAQLVNYLYRLDPSDAEARKIKADALRQMAYVSTGANNRAHLMSQALALEGKLTLPRVIPPAPETITAYPDAFVDYFRVRINPVKSGDTDRVLRFDFQDGTSVGLHVRRAVVIPSAANIHEHI